ncbi:MAG: hypothetical protein J7K85_08155 [Anaerolineaceae bacterium]|nr:hypothetical protein [Anaerolineaceae bacterium]
MKKTIYWVISLLLVLSMALAACKAEPEPTEVPAAEEEAAPAEEEEAAPAEEEAAPAEEEEVVEEVVEEAPSYASVPTAGGTTTDRKGSWVDEVSMVVVDVDSAITQIDAGAVDLYASGMATIEQLDAIHDVGLEYAESAGTYYELTFNPGGNPTFEGTGKLNPFSSAKVREAMNWVLDRDYLNQEIYGGIATPKFFPTLTSLPDYSKHIEYARALEAKYAYDFDKGAAVIADEMVAMGAEKDADGVWTFDGEPVEVIFLIRNDSDGTRIPMGNYIANQLEAMGFTIDYQYKTSSEASALWIGTAPEDGLWNLYTGAWGATAISRDTGDDFQFFGTPQSVYGSVPLWQAYDGISEEYKQLVDDLANHNYSTIEQRSEMFGAAMEGWFDTSYRVWLIDGKAFTPWNPDMSVSYDIVAGVDTHAFWPYTLRWDGEEGGLIKWGTPDMFVDPINGVGGSNWTYDQQWVRAIGDAGLLANPFTGVQMPQRIEKADVEVVEGLPIGQTYDWVTVTRTAEEIPVPEDAWVRWNPETQTFITAGEFWPEGATAKRMSRVYYPADFYETVKWHDGSNFSIADIVMDMIMTFEPGTEGSAIYDEAAAATLESSLAPFKGWKIVSEDPLIIETYSDYWTLDAEGMVDTLWPNYGYGDASWSLIALSNVAEAAGTLAYSSDKADAAEIEWMNWIAGPSLEVMAADLEALVAEPTIPYEPTLGQYITVEEAAARYANLQAFYEQYGHFYAGTGPMILSEVYPTEQTVTLKNNPDYVDYADKWSLFTEPKIAVAELYGAGRVAIGEPSTFDVYLTYKGEAYPLSEVEFVKYLLFNSDGSLVEVGEATPVEDGYFVVELSEEATGALVAGACKMEVAAVVIPVALPSFATFEFVAQ